MYNGGKSLNPKGFRNPLGLNIRTLPLEIGITMHHHVTEAILQEAIPMKPYTLSPIQAASLLLLLTLMGFVAAPSLLAQ